MHLVLPNWLYFWRYFYFYFFITLLEHGAFSSMQIFFNTISPVSHSKFTVHLLHTTYMYIDLQHRIALQLCVAHCLRSLSSLRCGVEKSLRTTNQTIFLAHINLSVGSACQNALCSPDDATKAVTAAVRRLCISFCIKTGHNVDDS